MTTAPPSPTAPVTTRIVVSGIVQGVNYRRWLRDEALKQGVSGWCRNLSDGSVEAVLQGDTTAVEAVIEAARRGPSLARVDKLLQGPAEYRGTKDFRIEQTV